MDNKKYLQPNIIVYKFNSSAFLGMGDLGSKATQGGDAKSTVSGSSNKGGIDWELFDDEEDK